MFSLSKLRDSRPKYPGHLFRNGASEHSYYPRGATITQHTDITQDASITVLEPVEIREEAEKWDAQEVAAEHHRVSSESAISEANANVDAVTSAPEDVQAIDVVSAKVAATPKRRSPKKEAAALEAALAVQSAEPITQMQRDLPFRKSLSDMLQTQDVARSKWVMESQERQTELGRKAAAGK